MRTRLAPLTLLLAVAWLAAGCGEQEPAARALDPTTADGSPVDGWRTEVWGELAVDVPPEWGWSQGAVDLRPDPGRCSDGIDGPYVGRPVSGSDVCSLLRNEETPTSPYVWLDPPLEAGEEDLGSSWVRETRVSDLGTVSVASDDPDLRAQVLGSMRPQQLCEPRLERVPGTTFQTTTEGPGTVLDATACFYRSGDDGSVLALALVPDEDLLRAVWQTASYGMGDPDPICPETTGSAERGEVLVVVSHTHDDFGAQDAAPLVQRVVLPLTCDRGRETVRDLDVPGLAATSSALIGPLG